VAPLGLERMVDALHRIGPFFLRPEAFPWQVVADIISKFSALSKIGTAPVYVDSGTKRTAFHFLFAIGRRVTLTSVQNIDIDVY
jgi:hypothetical protein